MVNITRICRDCTVPGCGAKNLVKLSNHLADKYGLSRMERKAFLQKARSQPRVQVVVYLKSYDKAIHPKYGERVLYKPSYPKKILTKL